MKGLVTVFLLIIISVTLFACVNDSKLEKLSTPENFSIVEGVLFFDAVNGAQQYRIEVENLDNQSKKMYFVNLNHDLNELYLQPNDYMIRLQAVGDKKIFDDSDFTETVAYTQVDPYLVNTIEESFLNDPLSVQWLGRHHYNETNKTKFFYFTASGFEVKFYGTSLSVEFITGANPLGKEPHLYVFVDGENDPRKASLIILDKPKDTYVIADGLTEGEHTVRVLKRSESIDSTTGVTKIETDGHFLEPNALKTRKIEVIAASSSAGFGNLASSSSEPKSTQNSDGLRAYAYLAARMLDAEINIFSASGWPALKGPWTGDNNIPKAYDFVNVYSDVVWNHNNYEPDVVIINLGTNDWSYITTLSGDARAQAIINFEQAYVNFIQTIHTIHENASIVIVYGLMNETNIYTPTLNIVNQANELLPNLDLYYIQLPSVNAADGIGSSNHPSLATHIKAGQSLAEALNEWLDWNIVRENITIDDPTN